MAGQEQALDAANFMVVGAGGGGASGGGSAGGAFALDREATTRELTNLRDIHARIQDLLINAAPMWSIQSPGNDPASLRNTDACNKSGLAYQASLVRQRDFVTMFIEKIENALGIHAANEEQATQAVSAPSAGGYL